MLLADFAKSLKQMEDARFLRVLLRALGLTVLLLIAFFVVFMIGFGWVMPDTIVLPIIGEVAFLSSLLSWAAILALIVMSAFLMFPVASVFVGFFLDEIVDAVEAKHYPNLPKVAPLPFGDVLIDALKFLVVMILANLVALVVYLLATVFAPFVFWAVNGLLLGREYFHMVASRRLGRTGADRLRKQHFFGIWAAGILMAVPLSIPLLNLFVPILGVAVFTHQFHRLTG